MHPMFHPVILLVSFCSVLDEGLSASRPQVSAASPRIYWGDFDADGLADAFVIDPLGTGRLFRNLGAGRFVERTTEAGLEGIGTTSVVVWEDFDGDGRLDLFVGAPNGAVRLLRNDSAGGFFDVSAEAGIANQAAAMIGARAVDFDADGQPDLHLVTSSGDRLLHNLGAGLFEPVDLPLSATPADGFVLPPQTETPVEEPSARVPATPVDRDAPVSNRRPISGMDLEGAGVPKRATAASDSVQLGHSPLGPFKQVFACAPSVLDGAAGGCVSASSIPTFGMLYPLGPELNIAPGGEVGLGTTTPSHRLTVQSPSDDALRLIGPNLYGDGARLNFGDSDFVYLFEDEDDKLEIYAAQRTALMGGNVGIGTSTPAAKLEVLSSTGRAIRAESPNSDAIFGVAHGGANFAGVFGTNDGGGYGIQGYSSGGGAGVFGYTFDAASRGGAFENYGAGVGLQVRGQGQTRSNAALRVENDNAVQGMAAYVANSSDYATAHFQNDGSGEVLWLDNRGSGPYIVGLDGTTGTWNFWVEEDGKTNVRVLQIHGGADLSEPFDIASQDPSIPTAEAGMVVCIDPENPGKLVVSSDAYDRTVAGIISGAGGVSPGVIMGQNDTLADGELPVALTGRVYVWCDAGPGAIRPGDLLTSSALAGHAQRVNDTARAQGAVLGKAMTALDKGTGLVLVLVSLQ